MNTSGFHQNVGEGNKSLNAMSSYLFLNIAFGKGSDRNWIQDFLKGGGHKIMCLRMWLVGNV